ncbi:MAG: DUF2007 domain-containing protein [Vicinamibacteria bacterium]
MSGEWIAVAETRELFEAELIALRLRSGGLEASVLDQSFRQEPLPDVRAFANVRVMVRAADAEAARRLLAQGEPLPENGESDPSESEGGA